MCMCECAESGLWPAVLLGEREKELVSEKHNEETRKTSGGSVNEALCLLSLLNKCEVFNLCSTQHSCYLPLVVNKEVLSFARWLLFWVFFRWLLLEVCNIFGL